MEIGYLSAVGSSKCSSPWHLSDLRQKCTICPTYIKKDNFFQWLFLPNFTGSHNQALSIIWLQISSLFFGEESKKDLFCQSMGQQGLQNFQSVVRQSGLQQQQINQSETNSNVEKINWNWNKTYVFLCLDQNWTEETKGHLSHLGQAMDQQGLFNLKSVVRGHGLHQWQTVYPRSSWSIQLVGKTDRQAVACAMSKELETNWKN